MTARRYADAHHSTPRPLLTPISMMELHGRGLVEQAQDQSSTNCTARRGFILCIIALWRAVAESDPLCELSWDPLVWAFVVNDHNRKE